MSIQSLVDTIAHRVNIDQPLAEKLTGSVFSVLQHTTPEIGQKVFELLPDAKLLAENHDVLAAGSSGIVGVFSGLMGTIAGEKMSALLKGAANLRTSGLSNEQITDAGNQVFLYIRERDPNLVDQLIVAAPSIKEHFRL
ncbi:MULTISPECIES: DUF2267 domain-containing protein [Brucella/Ochrobactrum group]|uniref:DUF2267 domain-containing protein n=1 Tax=Brucella/Ochrobactrum group TaxID=2826938 RepID=UPI001C057F4A|nr:DUF2267 domain-containing protein [Brucella sp. NBRC 12950]QWK79014.1 DUF2267 domain-containing protein [Ochrobactrum sp. BTU1]GLU25602.1 hypothetical protein Brsp01_08350 [Brucella sp. NBRC 12950]